MKNTPEAAAFPHANQFIDLHLHLDGAITPDIARRLAALQKITLPENDNELADLLTVSPDCENLNDFLARFVLPISLLQTPEALCEAVKLVSAKMWDEALSKMEVIKELEEQVPKSFAFSFANVF